jgi:hypothetical protein
MTIAVKRLYSIAKWPVVTVVDILAVQFHIATRNIDWKSCGKWSPAVCLYACLSQSLLHWTRAQLIRHRYLLSPPSVIGLLQHHPRLLAGRHRRALP